MAVSYFWRPCMKSGTLWWDTVQNIPIQMHLTDSLVGRWSGPLLPKTVAPPFKTLVEDTLRRTLLGTPLEETLWIWHSCKTHRWHTFAGHPAAICEQTSSSSSSSCRILRSKNHGTNAPSTWCQPTANCLHLSTCLLHSMRLPRGKREFGHPKYCGSHTQPQSRSTLTKRFRNSRGTSGPENDHHHFATVLRGTWLLMATAVHRMQTWGIQKYLAKLQPVPEQDPHCGQFPALKRDLGRHQTLHHWHATHYTTITLQVQKHDATVIYCSSIVVNLPTFTH